ncbi:hypothetical protein [Chryseobacterium sp. OV279]|uniref:hypothetical protein n=1 Tax=Chryseobacterium sp. OV279 TaxID=1500285 RepID=UPI000914C4F7|nr:hypothetical protein [Chryseobacterium sp. OV279]SHE49185.1 hypothetical protein SAMN02787100_0184 [Chryseobacterium sp. OV279]
MKYFLFTINFFLLSNLYFSQQIYPINTFPENLPPNSYIKDINNDLGPFIGNWSTIYEGKKMDLSIVKELKRSFKLPNSTHSFYQDVLIAKYTIKDNSGIILQTNINSVNNNDNNFIASIAIKGNVVHMYYRGTNCRVGWGTINLKQIDNNQVSWSYYPNSTTLTTTNCPGNQDTTIYLPETENLVFTKQ